MLFVVYHMDLYYIKPRFLGGRTPFAASLLNVKMWLLNHIDKSNEAQEKGNLVAIQTVRNTMKAGVFVGGKALYITYLVSNGYSDMGSQRLKVRSLIISVFMFCSFLCWANVIRLGSSAGYYLGVLKFTDKVRSQVAKIEKQREDIAQTRTILENTLHNEYFSGVPIATQVEVIPPGDSTLGNLDTKITTANIPNPQSECITMLQMMIVYAGLGFRFMFVSIPFAFFSVGPTALLITAVAMVIFIRFTDRTLHKIKIKKMS